MSLTDTISKVRSRTWRELGFVAESFVLLGVMRAAILFLPFQKITGILGLTQGSTSPDAEPAMTVNPADIGWAVQAAAVRTPWESACLVQALTGMIMLVRRGGNATLYLGVAKDENDAEAMTAHAWLRCGKVILTGAGGVERFSVISSFIRPVTSEDNQLRTIDRADL